MNWKQIVWLASYPKSGNTWVRCFLDAYLMGEVDINDIVSSVPDDLSYRHQIGDGSDIKNLPVDIQMMARPMSLLRLVSEFNQNHYADVPLFVKTHSANMIANGIELLPLSVTKSIIYIVRDPRDVVISFAKHMGCDIDTAIEYMGDDKKCLDDKRAPKVGDLISSWSQSVISYLDCDTHPIKVVRYEDMKVDAEREFKAILEHAGIRPDMERLEEALSKVELSKLRKQESEKGFREGSPHNTRGFFGKGKAGGWREKLKPYQVKRIEKTCGQAMRRLDYLGKRAAA